MMVMMIMMLMMMMMMMMMTISNKWDLQDSMGGGKPAPLLASLSSICKHNIFDDDEEEEEEEDDQNDNYKLEACTLTGRAIIL